MSKEWVRQGGFLSKKLMPLSWLTEVFKCTDSGAALIQSSRHLRYCQSDQKLTLNFYTHFSPKLLYTEQISPMGKCKVGHSPLLGNYLKELLQCQAFLIGIFAYFLILLVVGQCEFPLVFFLSFFFTICSNRLKARCMLNCLMSKLCDVDLPLGVGM